LIEYPNRFASIVLLIREFAHTIHDAVRDATRVLPLMNNRSRPVTQPEKIVAGVIIQDEAFALVEKLYKVYLKNPVDN
jgi:hypothetical protein